MLFLNQVLRCQSLQSILVYNFTNMHAMSYRFEFFECSCRVNIYKLAVCFTASSLSPVMQVRSPSSQIVTARSESKYFKTSLHEGMISSKPKLFLIRYLSDLTSEITFDVWLASMIQCSKRRIGWNNSLHALAWRFYLYCRTEITSSPGIICIICLQDLRHPSEHGTSSMWKHLPAKAHITKLNELTETEVNQLTSTTVDKTASVISKRQESRGITLVSFLRKFWFDIQFDSYSLKWETKRSKLAEKDFDISEFHQDQWNRYIMLAFVLTHIARNAASNLELRQS